MLMLAVDFLMLLFLKGLFPIFVSGLANGNGLVS
jgi:hypothetical protein